MQYLPASGNRQGEIAPFAYMRGRTFENAVVTGRGPEPTAAQMKMFLTRLGENVTVIVNGDITAVRFALCVRIWPEGCAGAF